MDWGRTTFGRTQSYHHCRTTLVSWKNQNGVILTQGLDGFALTRKKVASTASCRASWALLRCRSTHLCAPHINFPTQKYIIKPQIMLSYLSGMVRTMCVHLQAYIHCGMTTINLKTTYTLAIYIVESQSKDYTS